MRDFESASVSPGSGLNPVSTSVGSDEPRNGRDALNECTAVTSRIRREREYKRTIHFSRASWLVSAGDGGCFPTCEAMEVRERRQ